MMSVKALRALSLTIITALLLTGCAGESNQPQETAQAETAEEAAEATEAAETPETEEPEAAESETLESEGSENILIAYFTWAENTYVEDPESVDVDATTSASVLLPGNAAKLADWIQQEVGGDTFSIIVEEPYSSNYDECLDRAAQEKAEDARPALTGQVANMEDYDIVFLGYPNWWSDVPMALLTFLESYDFSGKTVIPFCTHGTGGIANSMNDIRGALPDSVTILDPIGVYRPEVDDSQPAIQEWVRGLEL